MTRHLRAASIAVIVTFGSSHAMHALSPPPVDSPVTDRPPIALVPAAPLEDRQPETRAPALPSVHEGRQATSPGLRSVFRFDPSSQEENR